MHQIRLSVRHSGMIKWLNYERSWFLWFILRELICILTDFEHEESKQIALPICECEVTVRMSYHAVGNKQMFSSCTHNASFHSSQPIISEWIIFCKKIILKHQRLTWEIIIYHCKKKKINMQTHKKDVWLKSREIAWSIFLYMYTVFQICYAVLQGRKKCQFALCLWK